METRKLREAVAFRLVEGVYINFLDQFGGASARPESHAERLYGSRQAPRTRRKSTKRRRRSPPPWRNADPEPNLIGRDLEDDTTVLERRAAAAAAAAEEEEEVDQMMEVISIESDGELDHTPTAEEIERARAPLLDDFPEPWLDENGMMHFTDPMPDAPHRSSSHAPPGTYSFDLHGTAADFQPDFIRKYFFSERPRGGARSSGAERSGGRHSGKQTGPPGAGTTVAFGSSTPGTKTAPTPLKRRTAPTPKNRPKDSESYQRALSKELSNTERRDYQVNAARERQERAKQYGSAVRRRNAAEVLASQTRSARRTGRSAVKAPPAASRAVSRVTPRTAATTRTPSRAALDSGKRRLTNDGVADTRRTPSREAQAASRERKSAVPQLPKSTKQPGSQAGEKSPSSAPRPILVSEYPSTFAEEAAAGARKAAAQKRDTDWIDPNTLLAQAEELEALTKRFELKVGLSPSRSKVEAAFKRVEQQLLVGQVMLSGN